MQFIIPRGYPCFVCASPVAIVANIGKKHTETKRNFAASLPTNMRVVSGIWEQNVLMFLLNYQEQVTYLNRRLIFKEMML